ncbi:alpha,alpha-phosphotrehalase [Lactiplantibacillus fabifermentans]|uniref:Alpha,alpha-phosphotrehalase n=2 Tax=Lactiplantibacillus fabifermentans TaxID=483011 RepID=A0A0R2NKT4_9LACO|nr:alpha,alpha-phosphotrehalase [Lactiplantibacillus fabifermentans]ETY75537.1 alpha-amylase [Lactiplantibacillus fabifermentans T30PCM01]KRO26398.1 alpha, alpha-phosphotrehalase [Lactiplantibacillus fabifermentans DSM 21115]
MKLSQQVIYQIYPKSFYDSDGDGIGDLRGIIQKIPYLAKLNIDMIWFNPFFVSPQNDNGYDIEDYYRIDPTFGTMSDFEELVAKLKEQHIGVMLDMVFNHTSTAHVWFQKALAGDPKYQKFYYLRHAKPDGSLPTNWESKFGGAAWAPFGDTDMYYLHLYDPTQADLDWHNPQVRAACAEVVNYWRKKGVQGFRFDVFNVTGKSKYLVDAPKGVASKTLYTDTPVVQDYLKELNAASFGQDPDSITVGEMSSTTIPNSIGYTNPDNHELSMVFNFHHLKTDYVDGQKWSRMPFDFDRLKQLLDEWAVGMNQGHGWQALFWNNHDQPRALNRFGDPGKYRVKSAEMLATVIHLMRGTPFIYMGEELGMTDPDYDSMADYVDIEALNAYRALIRSGYSHADAFTIVKTKARDNSRTPMQWDRSAKAGFTTGRPWLRPTNQATINVEAELTHGEIFNYYQQLIKLRKTMPIIADGDYQTWRLDDDQVLGYWRRLGKQQLLVLNNFYGTTTTVEIPAAMVSAQVLLSNYDDTVVESQLVLKPYQSVALLLDEK